MPKTEAFITRIRKNSKILVCAAAISFALLCLGYLFNSLPFSFGGDVSAQVWTERLGFIFRGRTNHLPDSIVLINIAYDKTLVDYEAALSNDPNDKRRAPSGKIAITDRRKLLDFLNIAKDAGYRYIMLDVRFDDDIESDPTSLALFDLIDSLDNITFARHREKATSADAPVAKASYADYYITAFESNAIKYPLFTNGEPSMAVKMYHDLQSRTVKSWGPLAFDGCSLSRKSLFLTYPVRVFDRAKASPDLALDFYYYSLGSEMLHNTDSINFIKNYINDKIVIIGDFDNDVHDTSIGQVAGSLITLNAYLNLAAGKHKIGIFYTAMLFIIYFIIALVLIKKKSPLDYIPALRHRKSAAIRFTISFIGFSAALGILSIVLYLAFDIIYSIVLPSFYFSLINLWIEKRKLLSR